MTVTTITVNAAQAGSLLKSTRYVAALRAEWPADVPCPNLPDLYRLKGDETMLLAALERIRDKEAKRRR